MVRRKKVNRRVAQPRQRRRFPVRAVLVAAAFIAAATSVSWAAVTVTDPGFAPLKYVEVAGDLHHVTAAQVRDRVEAVMKGNFFTTDTRAIQRTLTALPWIKKAVVSRVWPDTLQVVAVEQTALARWGDTALVNPAGELFYPPADDAQRNLPVLQGPADDVATVVAHYRTAVADLSPLGIGIRRLTLDERHAWSAELTNGMSLVLGREDYDRRMQRFSALYMAVINQHANRIDRVDLRYSNGFAVHWRNGPSA